MVKEENSLKEFIEKLEVTKLPITYYAKEYQALVVCIDAALNPLFITELESGGYISDYLDTDKYKDIETIMKEYYLLTKDFTILYENCSISNLIDNSSYYNKTQSKIIDEISKLRNILKQLLAIPATSFFINQQVSKNIKQLELKQKEIDDTAQIFNIKIKDVEELISKSFTKHESKVFLDSSVDLKSSANVWLACIILISIVLIALPLFIHPNFNDLNNIILNKKLFIIYLINQLAVPTILIYILFFAIKNYRSLKHSELILKQKSDIMNIYAIILDNIQGKPYEDEITKSITKSIFEIHPTGYIKENNHKDNIENINFPISKIIDNIENKKGNI